MSRSRANVVPYENATSGDQARIEIMKILRAFGCTSIGFMDNFEKHELILAFQHRGRSIQLNASAQGWANMFMTKRPYRWQYNRKTEHDYKMQALRQGDIAVNSILRDWVKGQVAAVECGILSFEAVFLPYMLTNDGRPLLNRLTETGLLAQLEEKA